MINRKVERRIIFEGFIILIFDAFAGPIFLKLNHFSDGKPICVISQKCVSKLLARDETFGAFAVGYQFREVTLVLP